VARGLDPEWRYLFVIDGAKALRAGIARVFGERAEVQRGQIHKRRNVAEHLPKNVQGDKEGWGEKMGEMSNAPRIQEPKAWAARPLKTEDRASPWLAEVNQFVHGHFDVPKDGRQQARTECFD